MDKQLHYSRLEMGYLFGAKWCYPQRLGIGSRAF